MLYQNRAPTADPAKFPALPYDRSPVSGFGFRV